MPGAISRALDRSDKTRSQKTSLAMTMRQIKMEEDARQREIEDRNKQNASFVLDNTTNEWNNAKRWKGATDQDKGAALLKINDSRKVLGLDPLNALQDPRQSEYYRMIFETQKQVANGVGLDENGKPSPLLTMMFEEIFDDDFLNGHHIDSSNRAALGQPPPGMDGIDIPMPAQAPQQPLGPAQPKLGYASGTNAAGEAGTGPVPKATVSATPMNPTAGNTANTTNGTDMKGGQAAPVPGTPPASPTGFRNWKSSLLQSFESHAVRPLTYPEKVQQFESSVKALAIAAYNSAATPAQIELWTSQLKDEGKKLGVTMDIDLLIAAGKPKEDPKKLADIKNTEADNLRAELKLVTDRIKFNASTAKTWEDNQKLTRPDRERQYDLQRLLDIANGRTPMAERNPGELPENYGMVGQMTLKDSKQIEIDEEKLDVSKGNLDVSRGRLDLDVTKNNQKGGTKPDKYGRDAEAIDYELTPSEAKDAQLDGFSKTAILHGPKRVRAFQGDDSNYKLGKDGKTVIGLSAAGKKRRDEIVRTEKAARSAAGTGTGNRSSKVDYQSIYNKNAGNMVKLSNGSKMSVSKFVEQARKQEESDEDIYNTLKQAGVLK
ncbi:MAG: hypothetical protein ACYC27_14625 [Armatimonadota bacterium]